MPYILRDKEGLVKAVSHEEVNELGWEKVERGDKAYSDYLDEALKKEDKFRESDIQLARVLEDLISLLIDRDYIRFTDFPEPAQKRLMERQSWRSKEVDLDLIDEDVGYQQLLII